MHYLTRQRLHLSRFHPLMKVLLTLGAPPGEPGFAVDIIHDGAGRTLTRVVLRNAALSVSGGRPTNFDDDSMQRNDHIDPRTSIPLPAARLA